MLKNRGVLTLVVIAAVFLVAAYILSRGSAEMAKGDAGPATKVAKKPVLFPRDEERMKQRRRPDGALATEPKVQTPEEKAKLDAMQRALLGPGGKGVVFIEANAIRHAPLVDKMLRCRAEESSDGLTKMKEELGIDPLEDVDRVGFDGDVFVASGFFDKMKLPPELGEGTVHGDAGRIWTVDDDGGEKITFGKLGNGMLLTGADEAQVKAAIDRAEGRGDTSSAPLPSTFGQGEVYGTVGAEMIKSMLGDAEDPVAQRIAELVTTSTVRMNVDEDAALSLDLQAVDEKSGEELGKALAGAFAGLRMQAQQSGDEEMAWLLEQARVVPGEDGKLNVDVAVPGETLLKGMGCNADGEPLSPPKPRVPTAGPNAPPAPPPTAAAPPAPTPSAPSEKPADPQP